MSSSTISDLILPHEHARKLAYSSIDISDELFHAIDISLLSLSDNALVHAYERLCMCSRRDVVECLTF